MTRRKNCDQRTSVRWPIVSAIAPPGSERSMTGRATAVWTSATSSGVRPSEVISHEAPTSWSCHPKFADNPASQ